MSKINPMLMPFEIGDIFITTNNINPSTRFGGTWELYAKGRTIVGYDPDDTDFDTIDKTGGSKYLQRHNHGGRVKVTGTAVASAGQSGGGSNWVTNINAVTNDASNFYTIDDDGTGDSGNLQPYIVSYIWRKTA